MKNTFDRIFDEWLFDKDKSWNPFTRMFAEIGKSMPKVRHPEFQKFIDNGLLTNEEAERIKREAEIDAKKDFIKDINAMVARDKTVEMEEE